MKNYRKFELCAVEYPLLDIIYSEVDAGVLDLLGYKLGDVLPVDEAARTKIVEALASYPIAYVPGGAAANALVSFAALGGKAAFHARFGLDSYGELLKKDFLDLGVSDEGMIFCKEGSGICIIITTKDAERTMFPSVEAGLRLKPEMLNEDVIKDSQWVFSQGYMLPYSEDLRSSLYHLIKLSKEHNTKFAFSLSAPNIVRDRKEEILGLVKQVDLCFANEHEAFELTGEKSAKVAAQIMSEYCPHVVVTAGAEGVFIVNNKKSYHIPAFQCSPVDLTGAGDAFAGSYLYGLTQDMPIEKTARAANYIAMKVISQVGARLDASKVKTFWNEGLES